MKRRLRMVHPSARAPEPFPKCDQRLWSPLSAPVDAMETHLRMQAQSVLSGPIMGIGQCPPLTIEQARDVMRWYRP